MRAEKRAPRRRPLTTGWNAFGFQGARNRGSRQAMAQRSSALPEYGCSRNSDSPSPSAGPDAESQRAPPVGLVAAWCRSFPRDQFAMPSQNGVGRDKRRHVSQYAASSRCPSTASRHRCASSNCSRRPVSCAFSVRFSSAKERDHITLLALQPSERDRLGSISTIERPRDWSAH